MRKSILFLVLCMFVSTSVFATEIKLNTKDLEKETINYEQENFDREQYMQSSPEKLQNNGVILKNSIPPVKDLQYDSTTVVPEREYVDDFKDGNENNKE